ncbi:MAG: hypothetical protein RR566_14850, partial [Comamonas sp.]
MGTTSLVVLASRWRAKQLWWQDACTSSCNESTMTSFYDFSATSIDGHSQALSSYEGKVVLV